MEIAGASSVISVDGSKEALDSFQRVLSLNKNKGNCKHRFLRKNIFKELEEILQNKSFGLIVIDPPNLTPDAKSKSNALKSYSYLLQIVFLLWKNRERSYFVLVQVELKPKN